MRSADGRHTVSMLGNAGPSCQRDSFPVTHGLHDQRGEYTELALVDVGSSQYRIETATAPATGAFQLLVTCVTAPSSTGAAAVAFLWLPQTRQAS